MAVHLCSDIVQCSAWFFIGGGGAGGRTDCGEVAGWVFSYWEIQCENVNYTHKGPDKI